MERVKTIVLGILALGLVSFQAAHADSVLEQNYRDDISSVLSEIDIDRDLALEEERNPVLYVAFEHGLRGLPNLRAQSFSLDVDGHSVLSQSIEFNSRAFAMAEAVDTIVGIDQTDAVLFYQVMDNAVSLDLGVVVSYLEGSIEVKSRTQRGIAEFDEFVPMLYMKTRTDLPVTGMWMGAQAQGVSYADKSLAEFSAQLGWDNDGGLGIEAGYRVVRFEIDGFDEVQSANLEVSGPYAALNYHF